MKEKSQNFFQNTIKVQCCKGNFPLRFFPEFLFIRNKCLNKKHCQLLRCPLLNEPCSFSASNHRYRNVMSRFRLCVDTTPAKCSLARRVVRRNGRNSRFFTAYGTAGERWTTTDAARKRDLAARRGRWGTKCSLITNAGEKGFSGVRESSRNLFIIAALVQ